MCLIYKYVPTSKYYTDATKREFFPFKGIDFVKSIISPPKKEGNQRSINHHMIPVEDNGDCVNKKES